MKIGQSTKRDVLSILDYYLTFIHYFGFSINPSDVNSHYLSIKLKKHGPNKQIDSSLAVNRWFARYKERTHSRFGLVPEMLASFLKRSMKIIAISLTTFISLNHTLVVVHYVVNDSKPFMEMMLELRLVCTKFSALIFVLSWHYNQTKVRQLMKLIKSTSIYILGVQASEKSDDSAGACSGWNTTKACGIPVSALQLARRRRCSSLERGFAPTNKPAIINDNNSNNDEEGEEVGDSLHSNNKQIEKRILKWWIMCLCVTITHFALSEAEIRTNNSHLWQWLEDYSFHGLSNATISRPTLMFLATFDNYIYTVHVYGTRLIGSSIICIVCNLQRENIASLKRRTMQMIKRTDQSRQQQASLRDFRAGKTPKSPQQTAALFAKTNEFFELPRSAGSTWQPVRFQDGSRPAARRPLTGEGVNFDCQHRRRRHQDSLGDDVLAATFRRESHAAVRAPGKGFEFIDRDLFFILGESDLLRVKENSAKVLPFGYLSASIWQAKRFLTQTLIYRSLEFAKNFLIFLKSKLLERVESRLSVAPRVAEQATSKSMETTTRSAIASSDETNVSETCKRVTPTADCNFTCLSNGNASKPLAATELRNSGSINDIFDTLWQNWRRPTPFCESALASNPHYPMGRRFFQGPASSSSQSKPSTNRADYIEWQLERLASKYELIRTVNIRIDDCFGPMLFIQFSFLFLMSCIDLVYFSICFSPNTKTKYIIISGMILLWWPYILLYKFASDIASTSREMLSSIRRLARLSVVEAHSPGGTRNPLRKAANEDFSYLPTGHRHHPYMSHLDRMRVLFSPVETFRLPPVGQETQYSAMTRKSNSRYAKNRAKIINKLDHVFQPIHLSLLGIMTIDKFFLLNFAKIVITASVMVIQFITN